MVTVDKQDEITLKISHAMASNRQVSLEWYLFVPGELALTRDVVSENEIYYTHLHQKKSYFSDQSMLPLAHTRLAQRGVLSNTQYRVSLSLFAYQYVMALDKSVNNFNKSEVKFAEAEVDEVIKLANDILKRLRRSVPYDEQLKRYYANIDNYLSWYTGQKFLSLVAHLSRDDNYKELKDKLIAIAEKETTYRLLNEYNSTTVRSDVTRMSNKMRLLRRLIEYPIVLKEETLSLGQNMRRASKGIATGLVMVIVTIIAILAKDYWGEITVSFIIVTSIIYAFREIFKDDLRDVLWKWVRKGKPKWKKRYKDPSSSKVVGSKLEWLSYKSIADLPSAIKHIRKKRIVQREEQVIYYRSLSEMSISKFMSGYEETRDSLFLSMRFLTRLMDKRSNKVYMINNGQVIRENVEKRHLFNLIVKEDNLNGEVLYHRWKIVLNRNKIVAIEKIPLDDTFLANML